MQDEKIIEVLLDRFPGKRITCAEAREFAAELQIELSRAWGPCVIKLALKSQPVN